MQLHVDVHVIPRNIHPPDYATEISGDTLTAEQ